MIVARDIMTRNVITVSMELDLQAAALVFAAHGISGAPVIDQDRMLVGVLSGRDLVRHTARMLADAPNPARFTRAELTTLAELRHDFEAHGGSLKITDIMTPYAVSASEETPAVELAQIMCREKVHRVLILDEGRLTGIVSSMDIVRAVANTDLGEILRAATGTRREMRRGVPRKPDPKQKRKSAKPTRPSKRIPARQPKPLPRRATRASR